MQKIKNDIIDSIVESFIPKPILKLKPVIAGGFTTSLYHRMIEHKGFDPLKGCPPRSSFFFSDIDLWFLNDSPVWSDSELSEVLLGNWTKDINPVTFLGVTRLSVNVDAGLDKIIEVEHLRKVNLYRPARTSRWANTFSYTAEYNSRREIASLQFIKKRYTSIDELFSNFDMINCRTAYHNGELYISDRVYKAFSDKLVVSSERGATLYGQVTSALRYLKYSERFNLELSKEDLEFVLDTLKLLCTIKDQPEMAVETYKDMFALDDFENYLSSDKINLSNFFISFQKMSNYFPKIVKMKNVNEAQLYLFLSRNESVFVNTFQSMWKEA